MSQIFKLFRLQQIDSRLDKLQSRFEEVEIALNDNETLRQAEEEAAQTQSVLDETRKTLKNAEQEVGMQRVKIDQNQSTLYGGKVRNPKELQDLQNEAEALKRYLSVLEDRQLEAMLEVDEAAGQHQEALGKLESVKATSALKNAELVSEKENLIGELQRDNSEREMIALGIDEEDLRLYQQLRQQRSGVAVAKVIDKTCAACGSTLSASLLQASRSPNQIARCATCGRILYSN